MRLAALPLLLSASLIGQTALAGKDKADYAVLLGASPFGGSVNFSYTPKKKTSWNVAIGRGPDWISSTATIDNVEYDLKAKSAWGAVLWNHRPVKDADWFRVAAGLAIGRIDGTIEETGGDNKYAAAYVEQPALYTGVGFGNKPVKGFVYGFDIGVLTTGGPSIVQTDGTGADQSDALADDWRFGSVLPNFQLTVGWGF
ncbi:MAG: hypothetical protein CL927_07915 [Deltaproteobacteria bacterium]|nr:hypothetical protein [Deltaproteobacteria bacterium]HCH66339.1 hypothetical protein [Deltaproteobacteria bacterium]